MTSQWIVWSSKQASAKSPVSELVGQQKSVYQHTHWNCRNRRSIGVDSWDWFELKVVLDSACIRHFVDWLTDTHHAGGSYFYQNKGDTIIHLLSKYLSCSICFPLKVCSAVGSGRLLLDPFISQFSISVVD